MKLSGNRYQLGVSEMLTVLKLQKKKKKNDCKRKKEREINFAFIMQKELSTARRVYREARPKHGNNP